MVDLTYVPPQYQSAVASAAALNNVPQSILTGLLNVEDSSWNPTAKNPNSSATGLGQFINSTAAQFGVNQTDPISSIDGAATYLSQLYHQTGSWASALHSYGTTVAGSGGLTSAQQALVNLAQQTDGQGSPTLAASNAGQPVEDFSTLSETGAPTPTFGSAVSNAIGAVVNPTLALSGSSVPAAINAQTAGQTADAKTEASAATSAASTTAKATTAAATTAATTQTGLVSSLEKYGVNIFVRAGTVILGAIFVAAGLYFLAPRQTTAIVQKIGA